MRAWIYDLAILPLTSRWYANVLERLEPGSALLDVGIGTGGALARNAELVQQRNLSVVGVDIDADYVERSRRTLSRAGLQDRVEVRLESIADHDGGPYDAVYFSASFMLLPAPAEILAEVAARLTEGGKVYFTQTFDDRPSPWMEWAKPLLKRVTTIDFGRVTYEADFRSTVQDAGLQIEELTTLGGWGTRSFRLAVASLPS
ncbi:MAG: class I SAM-dependent methyltransferase [Myxococcales bacterium]|nr:class I SAM-dependent methyltransferase [Myxococcales bacterium]